MEQAERQATRRRPGAEDILGITKQEGRVVESAAKGLTDKEIAKQRGITISSVRTYWDRLREKLKAHSRTHVVAIVVHALLREREKALDECEQELTTGNAVQRKRA